jgi:protein gp37
MSAKTKIQWCDSTCNPTMGCDGCEIWNSKRKTCYAGMLHCRYGGANPGFAPTFEQVSLYPGRMAKAARWSDLTGERRPGKPWLNGVPRLIFVSDMSDSLSKEVSFQFLHDEIITVVDSELGQRHRWLWLTKRPKRMAEFSVWLRKRKVKWPDNLWAGTSVTSQATTGRVPYLLKVGDARTVRFLSLEPQVEEVDMSRWLPKLNWVIQGGESGPKARPFDLDWARMLLAQCRQNKVPYFLKQLGSHVICKDERLPFNDNHAGDWSEWPRPLRVRQVPAEVSMC